jgi:hypothetical protein
VRGLAQSAAELFDEPRLAEPRFADNQHELAFASESTLPAAREHCHLLATAD